MKKAATADGLIQFFKPHPRDAIPTVGINSRLQNLNIDFYRQNPGEEAGNSDYGLGEPNIQLGRF